jgi:hypothetical protein
MSIATKLPVVGSTIEATMVASCYLENRERIQMRQNRLGTIRRGLQEQRRGGCLYASQADNLNQRIGQLRNQIQTADEEIKQEGREALKKAGMIILQEGAGAMVPGGGSIVAGVARARESAMEVPNRPRQAIQEGAREGVQDFCLAFAAEQVGQKVGCAIM